MKRTIIFVILMACLSLAGYAEHVVISEVLYNPLGISESGKEWIEIYNPSEGAVNISSWSLWKNGAIGENLIITFPREARIEANGYMLVGDDGVLPSGHYPDYRGNVNSLLNSKDGIVLKDGNGGKVDAVGWGSVANPLLYEGTQLLSVIDGYSIERKEGNGCGNAADTNNNSADFVRQARPNPQNTHNQTQAPCAEQVECLADADCDDGLMCNGAEKCIEGSCIAGSMLDCTIYNKEAVSRCDYDNNNLTWDSFTGFISQCVEGSGCSQSTGEIEHTCDVRCGGCLNDSDCGFGQKCESCLCAPVSEPVCGDNLVNREEESCDGNNISKTCRDFGFSDIGELKCLSDCSGFDKSRCSNTCGDLTLEPGENCDDGNLVSGDGCSSDCKQEIFDDLMVNYVRGDILVDGAPAWEGIAYNVTVLSGMNKGRSIGGTAGAKFDSGDQVIFSTGAEFIVTSSDCDGAYTGYFDNGGNLVQFNCKASPRINNVEIYPAMPSEDDMIYITADVIDNKGVESARLYYKGGDDDFSNADILRGWVNIGKYAGGSIIEFYIWANDSDGNTKVSDRYNITVRALDKDGDRYASDVDCDDSNPTIHPNALDSCNDIDDDCDPATIDGAGENITFGDLQFGVCAGSAKICLDGEWREKYVNKTEETCDGKDNDCDGSVDEGFDTDMDGIADCFDNCLKQANADQSNSDNDAEGDACDTDDDNDNLPDEADYFPTSPTPYRSDVNGDENVDMADLMIIRQAVGLKAGESGWNPVFDLNGDGRISISDLAVCRGSFTNQ